MKRQRRALVERYKRRGQGKCRGKGGTFPSVKNAHHLANLTLVLNRSILTPVQSFLTACSNLNFLNVPHVNVQAKNFSVWFAECLFIYKISGEFFAAADF